MNVILSVHNKYEEINSFLYKDQTLHQAQPTITPSLQDNITCKGNSTILSSEINEHNKENISPFSKRIFPSYHAKLKLFLSKLKRIIKMIKAKDVNEHSIQNMNDKLNEIIQFYTKSCKDIKCYKDNNTSFIYQLLNTTTISFYIIKHLLIHLTNQNQIYYFNKACYCIFTILYKAYTKPQSHLFPFMKIKKTLKTIITKYNEHFPSQAQSLLSIITDQSFTYTHSDISQLFKQLFITHKPVSQSKELQHKPYRPYSLVLDLDETLIYCCIERKQIFFRPFLKQFLLALKPQFELIIFTASLKEYADFVLYSIEQKIGVNIFDRRLHRDHTDCINGVYYKNLTILQRDLSKVIIVDNFPENFKPQKDNGIHIKSFTINEVLCGDDCCLDNLRTILLHISNDKPNDLRISLKQYEQEIKDKVTY